MILTKTNYRKALVITAHVVIESANMSEKSVKSKNAVDRRNGRQGGLTDKS